MPTKKRSGNPAKKAEISSAKSWKKASAQMTLELPSGEVCLVKRPGLPQLIAAKVLPDSLKDIAQQAISKGKAGGQITLAESNKMMAGVLDQEDGVENLLDSFSQVMVYCVVEPKVLFHKRKVEALVTDGQEHSPVWEDIPPEDRDEDILYTDEVDLEDQMFIFNFVAGGSADLEEFRAGLRESMGMLENVSGNAEASV